MKTIITIFFIFNLAYRALFAQWNAVDSSLNVWHESVFFTDSNTGYVSGETYTPQYHAVLKKTTNAGVSWFPLPIPPADTGEGIAFTDVLFTDNNTGFVVGGDGYTAGGLVLKTTNGGNSWFPLTLPNNNMLLRVYFVNSNTGYVSGYRTIIKTTDGGTTWVEQNPNSTSYLFQMSFTDVNTGYVAGFQGIRKTTDGGNNWISQFSGASLFGIDFADANIGIAVGDNAKILRTTNGGNNWGPINYTYSTCALWRVRFMSSSAGYILGLCSQILRTSDGGANWCYQTFPVNTDMSACFFTSNDIGYIVTAASQLGLKGYILKTTNGGGNCIPIGIEPISNEVPDQFHLFQNYPNPFNPNTKIKFSLPLPSKGGVHEVKLIIFDILGREVAMLVNEELKPGSYEIDFDGRNLPSGVYYYKLEAGDFKETRKMILIK
ncbi:MAG TPA: YCF48-related protein [Ignavibacteria bacterium]|jgi:photosystem II stability/assembly factor-like uncharacterized protein